MDDAQNRERGMGGNVRQAMRRQGEAGVARHALTLVSRWVRSNCAVLPTGFEESAVVAQRDHVATPGE